MFQFTPGAASRRTCSEDIDPQTGLLPLGDMAISLERARASGQATSAIRVAARSGYLTIHSILHLLGYDHMDEGEHEAPDAHA